MFRFNRMAMAMSLVFPTLAVAQTNSPQSSNQPSASQSIGSESAPQQLPPVVVTANPLGSSLFDLVPPVSVMEGQGLTFKKRSTLGETLSDLPGMSSTYYGPNVSRPTIRGLDADRIRILQNGVGTLDASALSFDHAVSVDPMMVDRIEVVRGAAALLYGGSAVGGVVNVIDNRIPKDPVNGVNGTVEARVGGADHETGGGALVEAGNGKFTLHLDAYGRNTSDLEIRGPAVSERLRALAASGARGVPQELLDAKGRLPNSASKSHGGAVGGTVFWDRGSLGLSYSRFDANYGTVAEPTVKIDMKSNRFDLAGELHDLDGFLNSVNLKFGQTDYVHQELDAGVLGTTFKNKGYESRLEAIHRSVATPLGSIKGSFGLQLNNFNFSALGAEAFIPQINSDAKAVFLYEELPIGKWKFNVGGRVERTLVKSEGGGPIPFGDVNPRFGSPQTRSFTGASTGGGVLYSFTSGLALAVNLSATERAPTYAELFANGPHGATGAYEFGNPSFGLERSRSLDAALRMRSGANSGSVGVFYTKFSNFVTEFLTGNTRGADGEINPPDAGDGTSANTGEEILPEVAFRAVPAVFQGLEAQGRFRLSEKSGNLDLELRADYIKAYNQSTGDPLPRIAPMRMGGSLIYELNRFNTRLDVTRVWGQNRVAANELPTDGYTMVNAYAGYRFNSMSVNWEAFVRANNLLNVEARNHASFLKDIAPLPGRGVMVGLRASF